MQNVYGLQRRLIKFKEYFSGSRIEKGGLSVLYHFFKTKTEKCEIPFLVTKRSQKSYPICFLDPRPPNGGWFHLLFLIYDHFIKPKTEKRKIQFLVTKRNQKLNPTIFLDLRPPNYG